VLSESKQASNTCGDRYRIPVLFLFDLWVGGAGQLSANLLYITPEVFVIFGLSDFSKALQVLRGQMA
jgi:hypothetical protein